MWYVYIIIYIICIYIYGIHIPLYRQKQNDNCLTPYISQSITFTTVSHKLKWTVLSIVI